MVAALGKPQVGLHRRGRAGRAEEAVVADSRAATLDGVPRAGEGRAPGSASTRARRRCVEKFGERVHRDDRSAKRSTPSSRRPCASRILNEDKRADGRVDRRAAADLLRGRRAAPHARHRALHARPDPGAQRRHARRRRATRRSSTRFAERQQALHAPLQLPAVLGRRGAADGRRRPSRDRPRRARRARARAGAAERGRLPVHDPRRLGSARQQRLHLDGQHLRQHPRADGRRRADQGAGRRRGDGPDHGRGRQATRSSPTSPASKTPSATWTSRSPAPRRASPPCRWTSRSSGITDGRC